MSKDWEPFSDIDTALSINNYFLSVFNWNDMSYVPEAIQVFMSMEDEILCDASTTKKVVIKELDEIKKKSPGPDDI